MPWSRSKSDNSQAAKALRRKWETEGPDNRLFDSCFRIQREASEAASRYIPLIVENVRGAQPWVGRSAWNYGSFHLWGDVPALMPITNGHKVPGFRFDGSGRSFQSASVEAIGQKVTVYSDPRRNGGKGVHLTSPAENGDAVKCGGPRGDDWFAKPNTDRFATNPDGTKIGGDWFSDPNSTCRKHGSRSSARKAASAQIARIPSELSSHIARVYFPR